MTWPAVDPLGVKQAVDSSYAGHDVLRSGGALAEHRPQRAMLESVESLRYPVLRCVDLHERVALIRQASGHMGLDRDKSNPRGTRFVPREVF